MQALSFCHSIKNKYTNSKIIDNIKYNSIENVKQIAKKFFDVASFLISSSKEIGEFFNLYLFKEDELASPQLKKIPPFNLNKRFSTPKSSPYKPKPITKVEPNQTINLSLETHTVSSSRCKSPCKIRQENNIPVPSKYISCSEIIGSSPIAMHQYPMHLSHLFLNNKEVINILDENKVPSNPSAAYAMIKQGIFPIKTLGAGCYNTTFLVKTPLKNKKCVYRKNEPNTLEVKDLLNFEIGRNIHQKLVEAKIKYIAKIYQVIPFKDGTEGLLMEYAEKGALSDCVSQLENSQKMTILKQLFKAVHQMHRAGYIHRDLKLENIVLKEKKVKGQKKLEMRLIDFDFAQPVNQKSVVAGTYAYFAPELIENQRNPHFQQDKSIDRWALGIIAYHLKYPDNQNHLINHFRRPYPRTVDELYKDINGHPASRQVVQQHTTPVLQFKRWFKKLKLSKENPYDNLIISLLTRDPKKRLDLKNALSLLKKCCEKDLVIIK